MRALPLALATVTGLGAAILGASVVMADKDTKDDAKPNPYAKANNSWISLSGTVASVSPDAFTLNYGKGSVVVEMDDGDMDNDGYKLLDNDKVTVFGRIDDDLFERTSIEASSVYVENAGMFFYASSVDEEMNENRFVATWTPVTVSATTVQGPVTMISPTQEEFRVKTPTGHLTVECSTLGYDPLDDEGFQKIRKGDRVSVSGNIDVDFFEGRELEAQSVIVLKKGKSKKDMKSDDTTADDSTEKDSDKS